MDLLRELSLTTSFMLAKYTVGPVKILGGYEHLQFANPKKACLRESPSWRLNAWYGQ